MNDVIKDHINKYAKTEFLDVQHINFDCSIHVMVGLKSTQFSIMSSINLFNTIAHFLAAIDLPT